MRWYEQPSTGVEILQGAACSLHACMVHINLGSFSPINRTVAAVTHPFSKVSCEKKKKKNRLWLSIRRSADP